MSGDPGSLIAVILSFSYDELRWMLEETDEQCVSVWSGLEEEREGTLRTVASHEAIDLLYRLYRK